MKALRNILRALFPARLRELTYPWRERLGRIPLNCAVDLRVLRRLRWSREPAEDLTVFEKRIFSQNGEDGIIAAIFAVIGTTDRYFVEFGVEDGAVCNTALLLRQGWKGLQMDSRDGNLPRIKREFVSAENISTLFDKYGVPNVFDLLSIDIDGNDFWVWKSITRQPRVVVIEYNAAIPPQETRVIRYDPSFRWDGTDYFGAGLGALEKLGREKGYRLVACDSRGVNAFFVEASLARDKFAPLTLEALYRPLGAPHAPKPHSGNGDWLVY